MFEEKTQELLQCKKNAHASAGTPPRHTPLLVTHRTMSSANLLGVKTLGGIESIRLVNKSGRKDGGETLTQALAVAGEGDGWRQEDQTELVLSMEIDNRRTRESSVKKRGTHGA